MPYKTNASLPAAVKKNVKSPKKKRQFRHVFNSVLSRHPGDEGRAFAAAYSVSKRRGVG